jgi:hypothetical protein
MAEGTVDLNRPGRSGAAAQAARSKGRAGRRKGQDRAEKAYLHDGNALPNVDECDA